MLNCKQVNKRFVQTIFVALLMAVFIGSGIIAAEENKHKGILVDENKNSVNQTIPKKKAGKVPNKFVSTEEVSADQAVAFPTDI